MAALRVCSVICDRGADDTVRPVTLPSRPSATRPRFWRAALRQRGQPGQVWRPLQARLRQTGLGDTPPLATEKWRDRTRFDCAALDSNACSIRPIALQLRGLRTDSSEA